MPPAIDAAFAYVTLCCDAKVRYDMPLIRHCLLFLRAKAIFFAICCCRRFHALLTLTPEMIFASQRLAIQESAEEDE